MDTLTIGQKVGVMVDSNGQLKLFVDDIEQGVAASNIPLTCFVILDVYGQCEQVSKNLQSVLTRNRKILSFEFYKKEKRVRDGENVHIDKMNSTDLKSFSMKN